MLLKTTLAGSMAVWGNYPRVRQTALLKKITVHADQGSANSN